MAEYPQRIFESRQPAQLRQGDWSKDKHFLQLLQQSWKRQYADYIGDAKATDYVHRLRDEGRLFDHFDPLTLHAWIDDRIVAISALRPLEGIDLITMLEVHPEYQGRGIGQQLVNAHCEVSHRLMAHVSIHQPRVKAFYLKMGFHALQRATEWHGEHELEFDVVARSIERPL